MKIKDQIFLQIQKNLFLAIFGPFPQFLGQENFSMKSSCYAQLLKGFWHHAKIQRNLMIPFQENSQSDVRRQRWIDHISLDPSSHRYGLNKSSCSELAFKSRRYRVQCWSYQKLLHHRQHAKNQPYS